MSKYNVGYILMLNYIHTLFSNLQLKDIKSDVIGYFSIVIVTVRGFSLQINNTLFNGNEFELFLLKCKNKYNHVPSSCMIKWDISMFLSVPYMSIRLVHMQYWYDEITFISISDHKPIDGVLVGWATHFKRNNSNSLPKIDTLLEILLRLRNVDNSCLSIMLEVYMYFFGLPHLGPKKQ
jgi:hypothetical protein